MAEAEGGTFVRLAEVYDDFYVPALLGEWARMVVEKAGLQADHRVLDVGCGTGIVARTVADRMASDGHVVGIDPNEGMLAIARRKAPGVVWRQGSAEALPFEDDAFDLVLSQFALMFFGDRPSAIREMVRVLRPGGSLVVAVWASAEDFPIYRELAALLRRHYGEEVLEGFLAPHSLGSPERIARVFEDGGVDDLEIVRREATARFPSLREWLWIEVREWLLGDRLEEGEFERLLGEAGEVFRPFITADGGLASPAPGYIATAVSR